MLLLTISILKTPRNIAQFIFILVWEKAVLPIQIYYIIILYLKLLRVQYIRLTRISENLVLNTDTNTMVLRHPSIQSLPRNYLTSLTFHQTNPQIFKGNIYIILH